MSAPAKLYDLADAREILEQWLAETEGELTPEIEQLLAELDGSTTEKIENVALFIREQSASAEYVKIEEQRLAAKRKRHERAADSLKNYLQQQMERLGKSKVDGLLCTVALQKSPPSVTSTLTPEQLKDLYHRFGDEVRALADWIPEQYVLNKRAALELHKRGAELPAGITIEQGQHVRIR